MEDGAWDLLIASLFSQHKIAALQMKGKRLRLFNAHVLATLRHMASISLRCKYNIIFLVLHHLRESEKKPGDTHQFLSLIYYSSFRIWNTLFCFFLGEFNLSLPSRPVLFVLFFASFSLKAADLQQGEITHPSILTVKWPHFDGQHILMLLQEKHVTYNPVSDVTRHFLWPYCLCYWPLPAETFPKVHFLHSFLFLLPKALPAPSSLFILIARYSPSLIFSPKPFKRKLTEEEGSFHPLSKNHHFTWFACMLSFHHFYLSIQIDHF